MEYGSHPAYFWQVDAGGGKLKSLRVADGLLVTLGFETGEFGPLLKEVGISPIQILQFLLEGLRIGFL